MVDLRSALMLSIASKAKARTKDGVILVVMMHFQPETLETLCWHAWAVDLPDMSRHVEYMDRYLDVETWVHKQGSQADDHVWVPVEMPFLEPDPEGEGQPTHEQGR